MTFRCSACVLLLTSIGGLLLVGCSTTISKAPPTAQVTTQRIQENPNIPPAMKEAALRRFGQQSPPITAQGKEIAPSQK